jgi:hypothetical protein
MENATKMLLEIYEYKTRKSNIILYTYTYPDDGNKFQFIPSSKLGVNQRERWKVGRLKKTFNGWFQFIHKYKHISPRFVVG